MTMICYYAKMQARKQGRKDLEVKERKSKFTEDMNISAYNGRKKYDVTLAHNATRISLIPTAVRAP